MGNFAENLNLGNRFRPPPPPCRAPSLGVGHVYLNLNFWQKFSIGLHVILQIQIKNIKNAKYLTCKIILSKNPLEFHSFQPWLSLEVNYTVQPYTVGLVCNGSMNWALPTSSAELPSSNPPHLSRRGQPLGSNPPVSMGEIPPPRPPLYTMISFWLLSLASCHHTGP